MPSPNSALEYLTSTKIGEKGQLTVPKQFREDLGLEPGAPFAVLRLGNGLLLLPEQQRFDRLCEKIGAALSSRRHSARGRSEHPATNPETHFPASLRWECGDSFHPAAIARPALK